MITIDHISFDFAAHDEQFAHGLYANWDSFCRHCFEKVLEECLCTYEKDNVLHEIELLELDLGNIPEANFYQEFPRRLKEELLRAISSWSIRTANENKKTDVSRFENLLFYLEYGYQKAEWADRDFRLTEELNWAVSQQTLYTDQIINCCLAKEYILRRLLWQTDDEKILLQLYTTALSRPLSSMDEKRRFLGILLEVKPRIPMRFIHEIADNAGLHNMAELLDTISVRQIMEIETMEHAEVNLPQYWHYLYEWLIKYYPFNGVAIFGGKVSFIHHLHHRLLTFNRKRNYSFYLSKTELTASFLLEVFGAAYYIEVLNAIYNLQPLHADGTPVYDGYLNRELYSIFLQLSLLRLPTTGESKNENTGFTMEQTENPTNAADMAEYLNDTQRNIADKRISLGLLAKENPETLKNWLQAEAFKDKALITAVAQVTDIFIINRLLASVSFAAIEVVEHLMIHLRQYTSKIEWMNGISESQLNIIFHKTVLLWIGNGYVNQSKSENIKHLLRLVYREVTGNNDEGAFGKIYAELDANLTEGLLTEPHLSKKAREQSIGKEKIISAIHKLQSESKLNSLQILLESRWNTTKGFADWLEDTTITSDSKRELLYEMALNKPLELTNLLRKQPKESKAAMLIATHLSASHLLQSMGQANFHQAAVLSQTMEWLERKSDKLSFLIGNNMLLSAALFKALLLFMQDKDTLGEKILTESEIAHKFMSYLYLVYTGKSDLQNDEKWTDLSGEMTSDLELDGWQDIPKSGIDDILSLKNVSDTVLGHSIVSILDKYPEKLLAWLEEKSDSTLIMRIVKVSNLTMLQRWIQFLSTVAGIEHPDAFKRLMKWLTHAVANSALISDTTSLLLSWIKNTDWRKQTPEQMEEYFISNLFGKDIARLPIAKISDGTLPASVRKGLLYNHIRSHPKELLEYIRQSVTHNRLSLGWWMEWLDIEDWMRLIANLSFLQAGLLLQVMDYLSERELAKKDDMRAALATYIISTEEWIYNNKEKTIHLFVNTLPILQGEIKNKTKITMVHENLNIPKEGDEQLVGQQADAPITFFIDNAGLALLSPWFPMILSRVNYLNEDKKDFKDTESKVRAIFLLQYLTCSDEKEYRETELAFNRLLVALPMHIPLPNRLALTDNEKELADDLLSGAKSNWYKMNGTSVKGFQQSFITRTGHLEQQEERWLLTVETRPYDILLDDLPWQYKQIHFSWLKKHIQVFWHERMQF